MIRRPKADDFDSEAAGTDYLAKTFLEEVEFTDTGNVDVDGNKIVLAKSIIGPIGFIHFDMIRYAPAKKEQPVKKPAPAKPSKKGGKKC